MQQRDPECHVGDQDPEDDEELQTLKLALGHGLMSVGAAKIANGCLLLPTLGGLSGAYEGFPSGARLTGVTE